MTKHSIENLMVLDTDRPINVEFDLIECPVHELHFSFGAERRTDSKVWFFVAGFTARTGKFHIKKFRKITTMWSHLHAEYPVFVQQALKNTIKAEVEKI